MVENPFNVIQFNVDGTAQTDSEGGNYGEYDWLKERN